MDPAFEVHMLNDEGKQKAKAIAEAFDELLNKLRDLMPSPSAREWAIVRTKLEEGCFFAKKGMAKEHAA